MPRAVVVPTKNAVAVGRTKGKAAPVGAARTFPVVEQVKTAEVKDPEVCPLCIEEMDDTDLSFAPCLCGYRTCLFCYEKIKLHCRSQCPGCRREYGSADDVAPAPVQQEEAPTRAPARSSPPVQPSQPSTSASAGTSRAPPGPASKPAASQAVKKAPDQPMPAKRPNSAMDEATPGLPSGATWATQAYRLQTQQQEQEKPAPTPIVADDNAWPSLAETTAAAAAKQKHDNDMNHRRSTSASTSSMDRVPSTSSSLDQMTQDPVVTPEQLGLQTQLNVPPHLADAFNTAHVTTSVQGASRGVNVIMSGRAEPLPEASALQQAYRSGLLTNQEATAQLVALLRPKESKAQSLIAAGKVPPGFGPVPNAGTQSHAGPSTTGLSSQDNPVVQSPPIGRYQPIGKPMQNGTLYGNGMSSHASTSGANSSTGTYSMWSGLPGIDLGAYNPLAMLWQNVPSQHCNGPTNGFGSSFLPPVCYPSAATTKAPPPGFGPTPYAAGAMENGNGKNGVYKPAAGPGARYNPLEYSAPRNPPPGMPAYRPQLGTGL